MSDKDAERIWLETHGGRGVSFARLGERVAYSLRQHGVAKTLTIAATKPFSRALAPMRYQIDGRIDRRYGIDTQGRVPLSGLSIVGGDKSIGQPYEPTPELSFHRIMSHLPHSLASFTFVDVGCGKGRALFCASQYDFSRIVGIEFATDLAIIAAANAEKFAVKTDDRRISVIQADATQYEPPTTPLLYYFFQPFNAAEPYRLIADNLERSFQATPRKIYVVLLISRWVPVFAESGFLRLLVEAKLPLDVRLPTRHRFAILETPGN